MEQFSNFFGCSFSLDQFLNTKIGFIYFEQFLREKESEFLLNFIQETEHYSLTFDSVERAIIAGQIIEKKLIENFTTQPKTNNKNKKQITKHKHLKTKITIPLKKTTKQYFGLKCPISIPLHIKQEIHQKYEKRIFPFMLFTDATNEIKNVLSSIYVDQFFRSNLIESFKKDLNNLKYGKKPRGPITNRTKLFEQLRKGESEFLGMLIQLQRNLFQPLQKKSIEDKIFSNLDAKIISMNIPQLIHFHQTFLSSLIELSRTFNYETSIGKIFLNYENKINQTYNEYFIKCPVSIAIIENIFNTKSTANYLKKNFQITKDDLIKKLKIPLVRLENIKNVLMKLINNTNQEHLDYNKLILAEHLIKNLLSRTERDPTTKYNIDSTISYLVRQNPPSFICKGSVINYQRDPKNVGAEVLLLLFPGILCWCFHQHLKNENKFTLIKAIDIKGIYIIEDTGKYSKNDNVLRIISPETEIIIEIKEKIKFLHLFDESLKKLNLSLNHLKTKIRKCEYNFQNKIKYIGEISEGKASGKGKVIYPNGTTFVGNFEYNLKKGKGTLHYCTGDKITSNWINNYPKGVSTIEYADGSKYYGPLLNGMRTSRGQITTLKGALFRGNFHKDKINGKGFIVYPSGTQYTGEFVNGKKDGFGILEKSDGKIYFGNWSNDQMVGIGKMVYPNGNIYVGDWKRGLKDGKGTFTSVNTRYRGSWRNDLKYGEGTEWYGLNKVYVGHFLEGMRWGNGKYISGCYQYEGLWNNNLPNGYGTLKRYRRKIDITPIIQKHLLQINNKNSDSKNSEFNSNNILVEKIVGSWKDGFPHGNIKIEIPNKIRYEGWMINGKKTGKGIVKLINGSTISSEWKSDFFSKESEILMELSNNKKEKKRIKFKVGEKLSLQERKKNFFDDEIEIFGETIKEDPKLWVMPSSELTFYNFWM
ncbi:phosphatidylinositol-4-phosphate 5-kinase related [Anaeramoeba flamelloides]|uniref:Phosphatidylinositol-4-phosphate 5-kinase related n=1 Tax=Anaeramoeba flamelloides TaxID=1746091 RepID=A0AAV7YN19_9EUKA|nr:phosphatidylinositol-4-phosphate 5-kinase related [Anaeramoeba flamelloides]